MLKKLISIGLTLLSLNCLAQANPSSSVASSAVASTHGVTIFKSSLIRANQVSAEIFIAGNGNEVVMMYPGLGRSAPDMFNLGSALVADGYKVVIINPRGIGKSTGAMINLTLDKLGSDVWMVADRLKINKPNLLGHGLGQRVMRAAAKAQPNRVQTIVLLGSGGEVETSPDLLQAFNKCFESNLSAEQHLAAVQFAYFAQGNDASAWADGWNYTTAKYQYLAINQTKLVDWYSGGNNSPMLIVQCTEDKLAPSNNAINLVKQNRNSSLVWLPHCGHAMLPEQPQNIADNVISFLDRNQPLGTLVKDDE